MDKSWMYSTRRSSTQYVNGVESFLDFAFDKSSNGGMILCPCMQCHNRFHFMRGEVYDHLICWGFQRGYSNWTSHGETREASSSSTASNHEKGDYQHDMNELLHDLFPTTPMEGSNLDIGESEVEGEDNLNTQPSMQSNQNNFDDLLKDAEQKVYANAKHSKLSCLVYLYHIKCLNGWSNKSFSMLLEFLQDLLPEGNLLPKKNHEVKKIMAKLGLGYEKIDACPNGCMLFWNDKVKEEICSVCGASRWKTMEDISEHGVGPQKKKATNILRWFPLKPRLQRLFMSSKTSNLMKWHHFERVRDGKLRHPADALAWKDFDKKYPEFSNDPRNVRLALASDGFNPYRTMNVAYSIWPVFVIPYNLPPWYVMKQPNFILSLIIPGPKGPGNKIDVYMQPLIKELEDLWDVGVKTFDASVNENFYLKAAVLSTISDFPGYANLSGWSTKGEYACPLCAFDKSSRWLDHGKKWCYMGHRRWLHTNHCSRKDTRSFDGYEELRDPPNPPSGVVSLNQLEHVDFLVDNVEKSPWKRKSIFFKLPYWKNLLVRHNLDVMHIEKNVCDNIVGTLLGQAGKSKDNMKARLDLKKWGIREELHPKNNPRNNNMYLPKACYEMTRDEKDLFLRTLKSIKPPDEYSSSISHCVQLKDRKLMGMKSYDCHMLMQEYLPITLRGTLPDHVSRILIDLCDFFKRICLKDLTEDDLKFLESRIAITLCKMEQIFPPSFFTVMVHLVIHLVREVRLGGPVTFRWMYSIERDLSTLKSYVNNKAFPEGSIAEGYMARESLTFCSRYLSGVETLFSRPIRNDDVDIQNEIEESNFLRPGRPLGKHENSQPSNRKRKRFPKSDIDERSLKQAHRYVLFNVNSITPFRE
ncbi:hypothetical protein SSX86_005063 [Deinandra increscens subsp. villosa]|uniref:Transposase n=1 Tax=Deinandra increscens subsp. villosa TaxID=3103831 RepID=A0AAP0DKS1_9ASTR